MIVEERNYGLRPGTLNTLVYLWRFSSWEDRHRRRVALMADPQFAAFRSKVRDLVHTQQNRILTPASELLSEGR